MAENLQDNHPSVFQCYRCKTIIGDSYALCMGQLPIIGQILLTNTSNTKIDHEAHYVSASTSSELKVVFCSNCGYKLGKLRNINKSDSGYSTLVEIQLKSVITYKLGKDSDVLITKKRNIDDSSNTESSMKLLNEEMVKVQHVLLDVVQRLNRLEEERNSSVS